ncbi:MAG: DMT family transporter [Thiomonas arsenitoxydans]|nr:DMT family transporter [Thiomonas arsenitoxydans]
MSAAQVGTPAVLRRVMPWVFVLIWSTGFIVARYGMPYAPPLKFLSLRYAFSLLVLLPLAAWLRTSWPRGGKQWLQLAVVGALLQAGYLGGVWAAVKQGIPAGTVALIVGLQPLLTAVLVSAAGQRIHARQWLGLLLGFGGLALVVLHKFDGGQLSAHNLLLSLLALFSITAGTLWQKRFVRPTSVWGALSIQLLAAMIITAPFALLETEPVVWNGQLIGALAWSVLALTVGAGALLYLLIQRGAAVQVTSLIYWVPPVTALMGWALFHETLGPTTWVGMALVAAGVIAVTRRPATVLIQR